MRALRTREIFAFWLTLEEAEDLAFYLDVSEDRRKVFTGLSDADSERPTEADRRAAVARHLAEMLRQEPEPDDGADVEEDPAEWDAAADILRAALDASGADHAKLFRALNLCVEEMRGATQTLLRLDEGLAERKK